MTMMTTSETTTTKKQHFLYGLFLRLTLLILLEDGLLLPGGVRYTDIDYDVFTDAASHVAAGRSPYRRHTYRYTPFLAVLLSLPNPSSSSSSVVSMVLSTKYFGKILFSVADAICGYIILILRARSRQMHQESRNSDTDTDNDEPPDKQQKKNYSTAVEKCYLQQINHRLSPEFIDALWWLYNPLPINICTRGSAEALVVLLPVLLTVALTTTSTTTTTTTTTTTEQQQLSSSSKQPIQNKKHNSSNISIPLRATLAGILHGIGIHCKLYPVIYTVSFMANFSRQEQQQQQRYRQSLSTGSSSKNNNNSNDDDDAATTTQQEQQEQGQGQGWTHSLSEQMIYFQTPCCCCQQSSPTSGDGFPWKHPTKILLLALLWIQRLFLTSSSILFLSSSILAMVGTTYAAVYYYGNEAMEEGLVYHFGRIDHRHNYSMYWYWIYLLRGRMMILSEVAPSTSTWVGNVPLIPQILSK